MKRITLFFLFVGSFVNASGQINDSLVPFPENKDSVYTLLDEKQIFKGGDINKFIGKKMRYPAMAHNNMIEGKVIVEFIIEKNGTVSNINTVQGIGGGCDEEIQRIVALTSGMWSPGKSGGRIVRSKYIQPVFFILPR